MNITPSKIADKLLNLAQSELQINNVKQSLNWLEIFATFSFYYQCKFTDSIAEELIHTLSKRIDIETSKKKTSTPLTAYRLPLTDLLVMTKIRETGGHSIFAYRWLVRALNNSDENTNITLLLVDQRETIPGFILSLNKIKIISVNDYCHNSYEKIVWIKKNLHENIDKIYFLIHPDDCVTNIAFHGFKSQCYFYNHADHAFWLGTSLAKEYREFRYEGAYISRFYRNISAEKQFIEPIVLKPNFVKSPNDVISPFILKNKFVCLVLSPDFKLRPWGKYNFISNLEKILQYKSDICIIAAGERLPSFLKYLIEKYPKQMLVYDRYTGNLIELYNQANIFLDGFPEGSLTSLLNFVQTGKPFITLQILGAGILGSSDPRVNLSPFTVNLPEEYFELFKKIYVNYVDNHIESEKIGLKLSNSSEQTINLQSFSLDSFYQNEQTIHKILLNGRKFTYISSMVFILKKIIRMKISWIEKLIILYRLPWQLKFLNPKF